MTVTLVTLSSLCSLRFKFTVKLALFHWSAHSRSLPAWEELSAPFLNGVIKSGIRLSRYGQIKLPEAPNYSQIFNTILFGDIWWQKIWRAAWICKLRNTSLWLPPLQMYVFWQFSLTSGYRSGPLTHIFGVKILCWQFVGRVAYELVFIYEEAEHWLKNWQRMTPLPAQIFPHR